MELDKPDRDDEFVKAVSQLAGKFPAKAVSAAIGLSVMTFSAGWAVAKQVTLPFGERERAAVEAAYRHNKVAIPPEDDLVLLIENLSKSLYDQKAQLEGQVTSLAGVNQRSSCGVNPGLTYRWQPGEALVQRCKQRGGEFFKAQGFMPEIAEHGDGDTGIWGSANGVSAFVVCSEANNAVNVSVAAFPGCGGERVDNDFQARFLSPAVR